MVVGVTVPDVFECEMTVKPDEPTSKREQQFCERRMYVEVVLAGNVKSSKLAKVHLVESTYASGPRQNETRKLVLTLLDLVD